jgi:trans-aconitate 2-methyltransferase
VVDTKITLTESSMRYEFDGEKYEKASSHQKEWGSRLIQELVLAGDERILDMGCGDGALSAHLALRVPRGSVIGIDASAGMIDTARGHIADNVRFAQKDINALDYAEEFDVIISNATLHWIKNHENMLHRVYLALRDGGVIRFNFAADGNCSRFIRATRDAMSSSAYSSFFSGFFWPWCMPTPREYGELMQRSRFTDVHIWSENADRFFPDADAMIRWMDQPSLVPFLSHLPEDRRQSFRDRVIEQMLRETRQEDGRCFETFRRINVFARKHG